VTTTPSPLDPSVRAALARDLLASAEGRRWFRGKARAIAGAKIVDVIPLEDAFAVVFLGVAYAAGPPEIYVLPVAVAFDGSLIPDVVGDQRFDVLLLRLMREGRTVAGEIGALVGIGGAALDELGAADVTPKVGSAEQTNSAIVYGGRLLCKIFRAVEEGPNAEYEIGRFFAATHGAAPPRAVPRLVGALEHRVPGREASTVAVLFEFVPNRGDAWSVTLAAAKAYLDGQDDAVAPERHRLLGQRTAEMHLALASDPDDPMFAPEPFDADHQTAILASARRLLVDTFDLLGRKAQTLASEAGALAAEVLGGRAELERSLAAIAAEPLAATRIRIHGDYHLGQVLDTGDDFVIIDFEGEPGRPLAERRQKLGPLRDVAGKIRSYEYAGAAALRARTADKGDEQARLAPRAHDFATSAWNAFLAGYIGRAQGSALIPPSPIHQSRLLDFYLIEKCVYEVAYELNNRPDWVAIPLGGLRTRIARSP
jgi:maltose alpha-D-glucosyltransferase/alpha-amylase